MNKGTLIALTISLCCVLPAVSSAQLYLKLQYLADSEEWGVFVKAGDNVQPSANTITGSGQVTVVAPTGFQLSGFQPVSGRWGLNARVNRPVENPARDYLSFGFSGDTPPIEYQGAEERLLFKFKKVGACPDTLYIIGADDPFNHLPNSEGTNPGNDLGVFDVGLGALYQYSGRYDLWAWNCDPTPPPPTMSLTANIEHNDCHGNANGKIEISLLNPVPPVQFNWNNGQQTKDLEKLPEGNYSLTVVDGTGSQLTQDFVVENEHTDCVWPGDANADGIVGYYDFLYIGLNHNKRKFPRGNTDTDWYAQPSPAWNIINPGSRTDIKHCDADGNGTVNIKDVAIVEKHLGAVHPDHSGEELPPYLPKRYFNNVVLALEGGTALKESSAATLQLNIGAADARLEDLNGVLLKISFDTALIEPSSITFDFDDSWFVNAPSEDITKTSVEAANGIIRILRSSTAAQGERGGGTFGYLHFRLKKLKNTAPVTGSFAFENVLLLSTREEELVVTAEDFEFTVDAITTGVENVGHPAVNVFPNPVAQSLTVNFEDNKDRQLLILDLKGKILLRKKVQAKRIEMPVGHLPSGFCILSVRSGTDNQHFKFYKN